MERIAIAVFRSEGDAGKGSRAVKELHEEGSITVYAAAIISKDAAGRVTVDHQADEGYLPLLGGPLLGALIGVVAGPLGAVARMLGGGFVATMLDFVKVGEREDFVNELEPYLLPGRWVLVAEVAEEHVTAVDARLESLGAVVFRQPVVDTEYRLVEQNLVGLRSEIQDLRAERDKAIGNTRTKLRARIDQAEAASARRRNGLENCSPRRSG